MLTIHVLDGRMPFWSWLGAFIGMAAICWLSAHWLSQHLLVVGSFGATSVLIYAAPESTFAQPRNVLFGGVFSAFIGVACFQLAGASAFAIALSVSFSVLVMQLTHTVHPPGAAAALLAVVGGPQVHELGWWYPLMPIGIGTTLMLLIAILVKTWRDTAVIRAFGDGSLPQEAWNTLNDGCAGG